MTSKFCLKELKKKHINKEALGKSRRHAWPTLRARCCTLLIIQQSRAFRLALQKVQNEMRELEACPLWASLVYFLWHALAYSRCPSLDRNFFMAMMMKINVHVLLGSSYKMVNLREILDI
jgi:hypothetical protein